MFRLFRPSIVMLASVLVTACGGAAATQAPSSAPAASSPPPSSAAPSVSASASAPPSASPTGSAVAGEWVVVQMPGSDFTVEMPGQPTFQTQTTPTAVGELELNIATLTDTTGGYFASWSDYPPGTVTDVAGSLAGARDGAIANINGTLVEDAAAEREGLQGRAFTATVPGGTYQAEIYLRGDRIYQMAVVVADGASGFEAERYFSSFTLTG